VLLPVVEQGQRCTCYFFAEFNYIRLRTYENHLHRNTYSTVFGPVAGLVLSVIGFSSHLQPHLPRTSIISHHIHLPTPTAIHLRAVSVCDVTSKRSSHTRTSSEMWVNKIKSHMYGQVSWPLPFHSATDPETRPRHQHQYPHQPECEWVAFTVFAT